MPASPPLEIVIATGNPHKVEEMRAILTALLASPTPGVDAPGVAPRLLGLADLPGPFREPEETGSTFEENAAIKARAYAAQTGRWCLADDSGLEVDALGGAPGVISAHYATAGRDLGHPRARRDAENNARLLRELDGVPPERRTARFVCVMALATPPRTKGFTSVDREPALIATARGTFEGRIGLPGPAAAGGVPRGTNGFGYDPLFILPAPDTRTSAELPPDEKNARSHRAAAARLMAREIMRLARPTAAGPT